MYGKIIKKILKWVSMMKKKKILGFAAFSFGSLFLLSGCGMKELTDAESRVIASYAADVLLSYDASYEKQFVIEASDVTDPPAEAEDLEQKKTEKPAKKNNENTATQPSQEPTQQLSTQIPQQPDVADQPDNTPQEAAMTPAKVAEVFGLKNIEITYKGYEVMQKYPAADDAQLTFQMQASEDHKLVIFSFDLTNVGSESANCNLIGQNLKFRMSVNDVYINAQKTLLQDDLSQLNIVLQPQETRRGVIVCQVPSDFEPQTENLSLLVRTGGEDISIPLH